MGVVGYWILGGGLSELVDIKGSGRNEERLVGVGKY